MDAIAAHEHELLEYATAQVSRIKRRAHHRHRRAQGLGAVVRDRRRASARRRHAAQSGGHRGAHRASLRAAGDAALSRARDTRAPRSRSTTRMAEVDALDRRHPQRCRRCSRNGRPQGAVSGGHPRPQPEAAQLRRAARTRATMRKATTRCAAIASTVALDVDGERIGAIAFRGRVVRDLQGVARR